MPYIKRKDRAKFIDQIRELVKSISTPGELNYTISVLSDSLAIKFGRDYNAYNSVIGALECSKLELYRRVVAEHEEKKIRENGDVF